MSALIHIAESKRPAETRPQLDAVIAALDRLFAHEIPTWRSRPHLRLVGPALSVLKADQMGEGLRLFLRSRGRDLYTIGGDEELMLAFSAVMRERPDRRAFNRTLLASLWSDIGVDE
jgi:hypothetical protein